MYKASMRNVKSMRIFLIFFTSYASCQQFQWTRLVGTIQDDERPRLSSNCEKWVVSAGKRGVNTYLNFPIAKLKNRNLTTNNLQKYACPSWLMMDTCGIWSWPEIPWRMPFFSRLISLIQCCDAPYICFGGYFAGRNWLARNGSCIHLRLRVFTY